MKFIEDFLAPENRRPLERIVWAAAMVAAVILTAVLVADIATIWLFPPVVR